MEELVLQYSYLSILCLDKNVLLKIVVLLSNHENYLQTIFLGKNIEYLLSCFLREHFLYLPFHSHCKEYYL